MGGFLFDVNDIKTQFLGAKRKRDESEDDGIAVVGPSNAGDASETECRGRAKRLRLSVSDSAERSDSGPSDSPASVGSAFGSESACGSEVLLRSIRREGISIQSRVMVRIMMDLVAPR